MDRRPAKRGRPAGLLLGGLGPELRVTPVRLAHLRELREAFGGAYVAVGRVAPGWTEPAPTAGSTPIRPAHVMELRVAVLALE